MIAQEVFGIGGSELLLLLVLAVIMFGPEKLPAISRKVARFVHFFRGFANQAMGSLREELGPEYKDLKLTDLNPKTLVRKTLLAGIEDDIDDIKREIDGVRADLMGTANDINHEVNTVKTSVNALTATANLPELESASETANSALSPVQDQSASSTKDSTQAKQPHIPWDDEAT